MPDDDSIQALMYGPLVLAGDLGADGLTDEMQHGDPGQPVKSHFLLGDPVGAPEFQARGNGLETWIKPAGEALTFSTVGQPRNVRLLPLNRVVRQRYGVYWRVRTQPAGLTSGVRTTRDEPPVGL